MLWFGRDIVDHDDLHHALEGKVADFFKVHHVLDCGSDPTADKDLPILSLGAEPVL